MPSTASALSAMRCRNIYPLAFLTLWHFDGLSDRHRRVLLFSAVIIFGFLVWFSAGCIYRADPNQDYMGQRKEKTMKSACIFSIIRIFELENAESAESEAVSVNIFQELPPCTPCTLAHFENAKVSRMPWGNFEIIRIPHILIP